MITSSGYTSPTFPLGISRTPYKPFTPPPPTNPPPTPRSPALPPHHRGSSTAPPICGGWNPGRYLPNSSIPSTYYALPVDIRLFCRHVRRHFPRRHFHLSCTQISNPHPIASGIAPPHKIMPPSTNALNPSLASAVIIITFS